MVPADIEITKNVCDHPIPFTSGSKRSLTHTVSSVHVGMLADKEIIIQGNLAAEVESYLVDTYDLPKHLIGSTILKGVKPKKK